MKLYNDYNSYLKDKYGCKVYRIGIDAGLSCPNRDDKNRRGGCIYCGPDGSRAPYANPDYPVGRQLDLRIEYLTRKGKADKFIAYFQAFSNTYASIDELKRLYDEILPFKNIVGLSIGTRPDVIDRAKLELIASYRDNGYDVWVEYGLQSVHNRTLDYINRGSTFEKFREAVKLTKEYGILVSAHVILGLPGETKEEMMVTARAVSSLKVDGIKIHPLHVVRGSALEKLYNEGTVNILEQGEYVEIACDFLENLSPEIIIQRLTGQGTPESHIAPKWALDKIGTINRIGETLRRRGTHQGASASIS